MLKQSPLTPRDPTGKKESCEGAARTGGSTIAWTRRQHMPRKFSAPGSCLQPSTTMETVGFPLLSMFSPWTLSRWKECRTASMGQSTSSSIPKSKNAGPRSRRAATPSEILVTLGGSDTYGMTPRVLSALGGMQIPPAACVSLGPNFNHREALNSALAKYPGRVRIYDNPSSLVRLIAKAEIIVCGGGVTLFEAAALGVPALAIANEPHEVPTVQWFEEKGFCICLGFRENGVESRLSYALPNLLSGSDRLEQMSITGRSLVEREGSGTDRGQDQGLPS